MNDEQIDRFYVDAGQRINKARRDAGLTQQALAAVSGLTRSSVANVEAGRQRIPLHVLASMAKPLGVEPGVLFSAHLLDLDANSTAVTLPPLVDGETGTREFIEGALASVGMTARWER